MQVVNFIMIMASSAMAVDSNAALQESVQDFERDAKNRPVSKVMALLKDMVTQLEKEGEEDEEVYNTMGCWCVTNEKSKTKSIADAETDIETLTSSIESLSAQAAKLSTEIPALEAEINKNSEAIATATSMREKDLAEFNQEEKESLVIINQLKNGLIALSKVHAASLLKEKAVVKKHSMTGFVDATKSDNADSGSELDPNFVKQVETEAVRAHMHTILNKYIPDFVTAFLQVNHDSLKPAQRKEFTSFLQSSSPVDQFLHPSDAVPKRNAICQICPSCALCNANYAKQIRNFAAIYKVKHPVKRTYKAPELPVAVQSLLSQVIKGVDTGLLESDIDFKGIDTGLLESGVGLPPAPSEPASGQIFGVLKQMRENFEINLEQAQQAEAKASDEFDQMKAAKEDQIKTATELVDKKTDQLADVNEKKAEDTEIKENTEASLEADQSFLADLKERCASMDEEFAARTKGRQLEIEAVSKALAFLSSDEAHDLFTRTFNPVLVQVNMNNQRRLAAVKILKTSAKRSKDARLLKLASKATRQLTGDMIAKRGDNAAFDTVRKEVNEMIKKLKTEQTNEMRKRDYCIDALNTNERDMGMKKRDKKDLEAHIEDLTLTIETLDKEIEVLKAEIAQLEVELKEASANRKKENAEFQTTVADQRATQKLLAMALKILADFYGKGFFVQVQQKEQKTVAGQAPPPGFKSYEKSAASGGVMGMMQGIIDDAKAMEAECIRAEEKAQKDFEDFEKDTKTSIDTKTSAIETKTADKAKAEADKVQAEKDMDEKITEIENLVNEEHALHEECDFILENFETSQAAREEEIESLKQANQIFSGASFEAFLERDVGNF
jgi:chaperonin cofactor prefoldin